MKRKLMEKICELVDKGPSLSLTQMESKQCKTDEDKKGLYFLYNKENQCIYVGKVGGGIYTSLFHRMVGHYWGSHKHKDSRWYSSIAYGKWYRFNIEGKELSLIERLAIYSKGQPIYNDCDTDETSLSGIESILEIE